VKKKPGPIIFTKRTIAQHDRNNFSTLKGKRQALSSFSLPIRSLPEAGGTERNSKKSPPQFCGGDFDFYRSYSGSVSGKRH
jgi:hypothetical protein